MWMGKKNRRVDKCVSFLLKFSRNMMFERIIREMKNKPTHRMQQISQSHKRSEELTENMVEEVSSGIWQVQSSVPIRGKYTVKINRNSDCLGCPLSCPVCGVCIHQFVCTCVDYLLRGNFCKHVHACIRYSQLIVHNFNEVESISVFEDQKSVIESVLTDGLTANRTNNSEAEEIFSMLNIIRGLTVNIAPEHLHQLRKATEQTLRLAEHLSSSSKRTEPKLGESLQNISNNANIDKQRFFSTKNTDRRTKSAVSKPTDEQKKEIESLLSGEKDVVFLHYEQHRI